MDMKKLFIPLFILSFLVSEFSFACGSWTFKDLEIGKKIRFKISGVELIDDQRPDPEFMQTSKEAAFFTHGDRVRLKGKELRLSKYIGEQKNGKRIFSTDSIGSFSNSTLKLKSGAEYRIVFSDGEKKIRIENANKQLLGEGQLSEEFSKCTDMRAAQIYRVAYYLIWKNMKVDPFVKPIKNWWW